MELIGYFAAILIGLSLGIVGGGGSILMVPLLVYVFNLPPVVATSYSLFIVGITSLTGAMINFKAGRASLTLALPLGIVSPVTVFIIRRIVLPAIPEELAQIGSFTLTRSFLTMFLFALLMLASAISMLTGTASNQRPQYGSLRWKDYLALGAFGFAIGCVTGFLGAGGGFLIIPALVIFLKLPMRQAIGTSLFIVAINSLVGFLGDWGHYSVNWTLLGTLSVLAIAGIIAGTRVGTKISPVALKKIFALFVLLMGVVIIVRETLF